METNLNDGKEHWRAIRGAKGQYVVSSHGRVRSMPRVTIDSLGRNHGVRGGLLKPVMDTAGYLMVGLGANCQRKVHRLVAQTFLGPAPDGMVVCHNNGNPADNRVENLRWGTYTENNLDAVRHGTHHNASKDHCPSGHPYSGENLYLRPSTDNRECRACRKAAGRAFRARKKRERALAGL